MNKIIWHSEKRKLSELKPASYNPRELTEKQAKDLSVSLERWEQFTNKKAQKWQE